VASLEAHPTILLFRSGRHLQPAVDALRVTYPEHRVVVVTQPATETHLAEAGVNAADSLVYGGRRFSPLRFAFSRAGWRAWRTGASRVAMLWNDDAGKGHINVALTGALLRQPLVAVTPDGLVRTTTWFEPVRRAVGARVRPWSDRLRCWRNAAGRRWDALRLRVEGPELEPPIWHSHYLCVALAKRHLPPLGHLLSGTVVDIGAGTGWGRDFLDTTRTRYLPTDLPTGRDSRNAAITTAGVRPSLYCDGTALPLPDQSVDAVMAHSVLEHVWDVKGMLDEAFRVLRPGGRLFVSTPFGFPFHGEPDDFRRWTVDGMCRQVRESGFEPERHRRTGASLTTVIINLIMMVKYAWRGSPSPLLRGISRWGWPIALSCQALLNVLALLLDGLEPNPVMPTGVALVARRPAGHGFSGVE
jgi:SAM-dependent methyltransferase